MARIGTDPEGAVRSGDGRAADARPAQHAVRHACPCGSPSTRQTSRGHVAGAPIPAFVLGSFNFFAFLGGEPDGPQRVSARPPRRNSSARATPIFSSETKNTP